MRKDVGPKHFWRSLGRSELPTKWRWRLVGVSVAVLATIVVILLDRAKPAPAPRGFTVREIENAKRKVLPFRQSGLVFHWADDSPTVYVMGSMWESLSDETKSDLGRSIAVAKNREKITVVDETLAVRLAICTARDGCAPPAGRPER
jgi:hypothetical protein